MWKPYILMHFLKLYQDQNARFFYVDADYEVAFKQSKIIENLLEDWLRDTSLLWRLSDTADKTLVCEKFIEHRHDQAVLTYIIYTKYGALIRGLKDSEFRSAFPQARIRHGKSNPILDVALSNAVRVYSFSDASKLLCSASSRWSTDNDLKNLLSFKKEGTYSSFSFHTDSEKSPFVEIHFKKSIYVSYLLIENRNGIFYEKPMKLIIYFFDELTSIFKEIYSYTGIAGTFLINSPLTISFPYGFKCQAFKIQTEFESPEQFHLRSVIFLN